MHSRKKDGMPQPDHDDLSALNFSTDASATDEDAESDALDFSAPDDDSDEDSVADALHEFAPAETEDSGSELDAIDSQTTAGDEEGEDDEDAAAQLFTVTNPPETVSVSALMDGGTQQIDLSPKVAAMTESELADEILVIADLARQKGLAGQHTYILESASSDATEEVGMDDGEALRAFIENDMKLSTPEQAAAAQAEVFATRYATDK
jgi:hypothetical protein